MFCMSWSGCLKAAALIRWRMKRHAVALCRLGVYAERVVDMALAEARRAYDLAARTS